MTYAIMYAMICVNIGLQAACANDVFAKRNSPIQKTSQASAWSSKYDGRWMRKTEGSPTGLGKNFGRLNG